MHSTTPAVRASILVAARRVLARDGAEALTLKAVAAEAELSVGGVRYHFASKQDLLAALVDALVEGFDTALAQAGTAPGDRTRAYIAATLDASDVRAGYDASGGLLAAAALDAALLDVLRGHFRRWQELLDDDGIDATTATVVRLAIDGWWLAAFLDLAPPQGDRAAAVRAALEHLTGTAADA
ncbi:TetR/AcrR family transcriptional regulator [Glycomyces sp. NPDC047369]